MINLPTKMNIFSKFRNYSDLILFTILGLFLRGRLILSDDLWYDEAFTGNLMRVSGDDFWKIVTEDPHPPLYYFMLKGWTELFGVNDLTLRSLALLFGVALIPVSYFLVKKFFNRESAAVAALLLAINPFLISYSIEARSYSFYAFMVAATILAVVYKKRLLAVFGMAILILTHYMAAIYLPLITIWLLWEFRNNRKEVIKTILYVAPVAVLAVYIYWPVITHEGNNNLNIDWVKPASISSISRSITAYNYGIKSRLAGADELNYVDFVLDVNLLGLLIFISYLVGIAGVIYKFRRIKGMWVGFVLSLGMVILPMIGLIAYTNLADNNIYVERYLIPSAVFFSITLAIMFTSILNFEVMGILLVFYIFTLSRIGSPNYYEGMKQLADEFKSSESEVIFTSPIDYIVGKYYFNSDNVKLFVPKEPQNTYDDWPFIDNSTPQNMDQAIFISADDNRMTEEFRRPIENLEYGDYKIWIRNPAN